MPAALPTVEGHDLTRADQFLACLWEAQFGPKPSAAVINQFWPRDLAAVGCYHPIIFNVSSGSAAAEATQKLIIRLADGKDHTGELNFRFPRAWLSVFWDAFNAGLIGEHAWGRAVRLIYTNADADHGASADANKGALQALRTVRPELLMNSHECALWRSLPPLVSLYRGSCAATLAEATHGVSRTPDPELAVSYALIAGRWLYRAGIEGGWPRLFEAKVPRDAIFGLTVVNRAVYEYLVDYERLPAGSLREVMPWETKAEISAAIAQVRRTCWEPLAA